MQTSEQNPEVGKRLFVALSLGALLTTAFAPEFHSVVVGSADLLTPGIASVVTAAICAGLAYAKPFDLRGPLILLAALVSVRFVLPVFFTYNGIVSALLGEISKTLGFLSVGSALTLLPQRRIGNTVLIGVLAACVAFIGLHHLLHIDNELLRIASYLTCALLALTSLAASPKSSPQLSPVKPLAGDKPSASEETLGSKMSLGLRVVIPYACLFLCFGIFEAFALASRESNRDMTAFAPYLAFAAAALVFMIHRFTKVLPLADSALIVIGAMFLGSLFALAITDDYSPILYNMLATTIIIAHIPLFVFLSEFSQKYGLSAIFVYGLAVALLFAALVAGETCAVVMLGNNWTDAVITQTAITALFVVSLAALFFLLLIIRESNITSAAKAPSPTTDVSPSGAPATVDSQRIFRTFCNQCGLTEREYEIISLYLSGRSTPFIGEKFTIANSTVKTHIHRAYQKLGVHNKQELIDLVEQLPQENYLVLP